MSVGHRGTPVESGGLCLSLPDELHAQPAPIRLPVESVAQPAYQMQPPATETIGAKLDLQRLFDIEPRTAVVDADAQATACAVGLDRQLEMNMPVHQRLQALLALLVVTLEALGVALEGRVQPQHAVLQRVGIQLAQYRVDGTGARAQLVDL